MTSESLDPPMGTGIPADAPLPADAPAPADVPPPDASPTEPALSKADLAAPLAIPPDAGPLDAGPLDAGPTIATPSDVAAPAAQGVRRPLPLRRFAVGLLIGFVLAAAAGAGAVFAFEQQYQGKIQAGVHVGSIDLSGLTRDQARTRLTAELAGISDGTVVVGMRHGTASVSFAAIGRVPDIEGILDRAFAVGRSGGLVTQTVDQVRTAIGGTSIPILVRFDPGALADRLRSAAKTTDEQPTNASVKITPGAYTLVPSAQGTGLNTTAAVAALAPKLSDPAVRGTVSLSPMLGPLAPAVTDAQARAAITAANLMIHDVVLTDGNDKWTIPAATVRTWIGFGTTPSGTYGPVVNQKALQATLTGIAPKVNRSPVDATFLFSNTGAIVGATASSTGRSLDLAGSAAAVTTGLQIRTTDSPLSTAPTTVAAAVVVTQPKLTTAQAQASAPLMTKISSWTTYYDVGAHNGWGANITIPSLTISGTVVPPGGVFDYWKAIGEVSLAKGYRYGGAIINGHSVEGTTLAGGICSSSTTLFNAAVRAGYKILARTNHYYYITRYPVGLDATVFEDGGSVVTMAFQNDTQYPLLIKAYATPGVVRFDIYSVPTGRTVSWSAPTIKNYLPASDSTVYTTAIPPGTRQRVEYPTAGFDAWVTRTVRDASGNIIEQNTFYSHYARVNGILEIGVAPTAPPAATPTLSPSTP